MSLTWSLLLLAAAVLVGLLVHGRWRARQQSLQGSHAPVMVAATERVEPTLTEAQAADGAEGRLDDLGPPRSMLAGRRGARLDALVDIIAPLVLEQPVSGDMALQHLPTTQRAGSKPFFIEGLDADLGEWSSVRAGARYSEFQAGVQMANRGGALNEIEYSEFVQKAQAFADAVGAAPELPDMLDAVARARELDAFASSHDAQLALHLRANQAAWSAGFVQQVAARHGFIPGPMAGRLVLPSAEEGAPPLVTLGFDAQAALAEDPQAAPMREVTLWLDVPQSPESAEPFPAWQQAARGLAGDLQATAVDDQGAPITLHAYAQIGQELSRLYRALEQRDLAAGSPAARRLFG